VISPDFCIIYINGGIYSDADFYCCKNLDKLLEGQDYIYTFEPEEHGKNYLYNGFLHQNLRASLYYGWLKTMQENSSMTEVMFKNWTCRLGL